MGVGAAVAGIGAAATVGSSLINRKGNGGSSSQSTSSTTTPWAGQAPFLMQGFGDANALFNQSQQQGPYSGEIVAGPNAAEANAENFASGYANGQGSAMPGVANGAAGNLLDQSGNFTNNASELAANGIGGPDAGLFGTLRNFGTGAQTTSGASPGLSAALNGAAINGANSLNGFTSGLQSAADRAASDPTQRIANDASIYANNPGVQAALRSTNANIEDVLNSQTVPSLNRQAEMGGNLNSSRAGMAEAMARKDAALTEGNADASILNNAYNTGMGTASNLYASGLQNSINANTSGLFDVGLNTNNEANREQGLNEFNTTNELGAANSGLAQALGYGLGNANTRLSANGQLGTGLGLGFNGATTAGNLAAGNFALGSAGGLLQQQGQQALDTNGYQTHQNFINQPWQNLDNYWNIVGNPVGSSTSGTATGSIGLPFNPVGQALGGAVGGLGLYQALGGGSGSLFGSNNPSIDSLNAAAGMTVGNGQAASGLFG